MLSRLFGEDLFDEMFEDPFEMMPVFSHHNPLYGKHAKALMKTDVREKDNAYELDIDLPGFKKEEIQAQISNGYLTVSASKDLDKEQKNNDGRYIRRERYSGACSRSFYVGEDVTEKDITAKFEDGILRLTVPKKEAKALPEPNRISIENPRAGEAGSESSPLCASSGNPAAFPQRGRTAVEKGKRHREVTG